MKTEQPILITTIKASSNINKHLFIGFDGDLCSAAAKSFGVSNADSDSGDEMPVMAEGIALVLSGAAVSQSDPVESDANAKAIPVSAGEINGYALDDASGADELIRIKLV